MGKLGEVSITLNITNNTAYPQVVNLLGNNSDLLDNSNATTEYRWNVTAFSFGTEDSVSIMYRPSTTPIYQVFISGLQSQNIEAVVIALNGLGIGTFNTYTELGQTYISTYNENYVFANLNIFNSGVPQLQYSWRTIGSGGNNIITINPPGPASVTDANPVTSVGSVVVTSSDIAGLSGTTSNYGTTTIMISQVKSSNIVFSTTLPASTAFNYGYAVVSATDYALFQVFEI